jgi:hypothetical protein
MVWSVPEQISVQEGDAEQPHAVFRRGQLRVGAELISCFPQVIFKLCKTCQLVLAHGISAFAYVSLNRS